jgi:glucose/arabinose dehydrogenase
MHGHAFIAFHGSWNRDTPTGYSVGFVPMTKDGFVDAAAPSDFLSSPSDNAKWSSGFRPVDVVFDRCGRLLVTSDGTGREGRGSSVVRISYGSNACSTSNNRTSTGSGLFGSLYLTLIACIVAMVVLCQ